MTGFVRGLAVAGAVGMLAVTSAVPATAAVVDRDREVFAANTTLVDFCDTTVDFTQVFEYQVAFSTKLRGPDTPLYFADSYKGFQTYTNLETNKTFNIRNHGTHRDHKITVNDDGTLTIVQQFNDHEIVRDDANKILFITTGVSRYEAVIDYNGTLDNADDDTLVEDRGLVFRHGKPGTNDRDFCADLLEFTA